MLPPSLMGLYFKKKCLAQSTLTQALNIFSVVSSPVTLLHLWRKKCLGEKSAWEPGSQVPAYYAGLLITIIFLLNPSLRRHAQSTAQMPNPIKSFSPKARFKVEECRAKV